MKKEAAEKLLAKALPELGLKQLKQCLALVWEDLLNEAGGSLEDIVELVTYHISMSDMRKFAKVKSEFIPKNYPAWTAVGVKELVLPGLLVEIRATAVLNQDSARK